MNVRYTPVLFLTVALYSCNPFVPSFDSTTPDTTNNYYHYKHLIHVEPTPDVKNLYTLGNEIGIDASYYLAFNCNGNTAQRIIDSNEMILDDDRGSIRLGCDQKWWKEDEIKHLDRYVFKSDNERYFKYFWHNRKNGNGYFLDFDL